MTTTVPQIRMFPSFDNTTNPALRAALETLPGYRGADAASSNLSQAKAAAAAELMDATRKRVTLADAVTQALRDGQAAPDVGPQLAKVDAAMAQASGYINLLQEIERDLASDRDQVLAAAPPALTRHLDQQLQRTIRNARALDLGNITTAQQAIDADRVDAWSAYLQLTDQYLQIREAQGLVLGQLRTGSMAAQHLRSFGFVKNYAELFPGWFDHQRRTVTGTLNGQSLYIQAPWDIDDDRALWRYAVDHHDVELWVADAPQILNAHTAAEQAARQLEHSRSLAERAGVTPPDLNRQRSLERQHLTSEGAR